MAIYVEILKADINSNMIFKPLLLILSMPVFWILQVKKVPILTASLCWKRLNILLTMFMMLCRFSLMNPTIYKVTFTEIQIFFMQEINLFCITTVLISFLKLSRKMNWENMEKVKNTVLLPLLNLVFLWMQMVFHWLLISILGTRMNRQHLNLLNWK